jgi:hypothetical protein
MQQFSRACKISTGKHAESDPLSGFSCCLRLKWSAARRVGCLQADQLPLSVCFFQTAKIDQELTQAHGLEPGEDESEDFDLLMLMDFAGWMLRNASNLWFSAFSETKRKLQQALFPMASGSPALVLELAQIPLFTGT